MATAVGMIGPGGTAVQGSSRTGGGNIEKRETRTRAILGISDSIVVSLQNRLDRGRMNNHHGQGQQSSEGKHDDDAVLTDFLASLMEYTPTVPDELVEHLSDEFSLAGSSSPESNLALFDFPHPQFGIKNFCLEKYPLAEIDWVAI